MKTLKISITLNEKDIYFNRIHSKESNFFPNIKETKLN